METKQPKRTRELNSIPRALAGFVGAPEWDAEGTPARDLEEIHIRSGIRAGGKSDENDRA